MRSLRLYFWSAWILVCATPDALAQTAASLLEQAVEREGAQARGLSATYEGTVIDLASGARGRFRLFAQAGDQIFYILSDLTGTEIGRWWVSEGQGWVWKPATGLARIEPTSIASWRLLALALSPDRFSALRRQAVALTLAQGEDPASHALICRFEDGSELEADIRQGTYQLFRLERLVSGQRRVTLFDDPQISGGVEGFRTIKTLRDELPDRLFKVERLEHGPRLPPETFRPEEEKRP